MTPDEPFRPFRFLPGGHLQTVAGLLARSALRWAFETEDFVVEARPAIRLLVRASWQPVSDRPALLLVHGLEGSDSSSYLLSTGAAAYQAGWHVIRMNMRGCGDSLSLCPRLYHAGLTSDLLAVTRWLGRRVERFVVGGFSLGAGLTLLTLARESKSLPDELAGAIAICPPLDMSRSADALEKRANWIYQRRFVHSLRLSYRKRQALSPELYEPGRDRGITSLRQFDDVVTAHYGGYRDAEHYYRAVSAGPRLETIDRPTLILASTNDPFIPAGEHERWRRAKSVRLELTTTGGHVGFVGPSRAPGFFWAAERMLSYLRELSPGSGGS